MTHEEAVAVMDQAFGVGAAEAHKLIETDAGVKAVYDSALVALIAVSQAKSPTDMAETPAPQAHVTVKPLAWKIKHGTSDIYAETPLGTYGVGLVHTKMIATVRHIVHDQWTDTVIARAGLEEVKLAAYRHYEDAILSAIQTSPKDNVLVPPIIGETIENLTQLGKYTHDIETRHIQADDLLCEVIVAIVPGGQRIVDAFKAIRKVYA